jgi:hypothetical protein
VVTRHVTKPRKFEIKPTSWFHVEGGCCWDCGKSVKWLIHIISLKAYCPDCAVKRGMRFDAPPDQRFLRQFLHGA